ncbi:MAG: M20 family metallopeptidase [Acidobacteriota bacterium]|nr:M20 family metallopeptidase [Acidobacteriota bacterium]MDH3528667.1 M20 family metallopeptidase [Acidobacteriota bacterium]
MDIQPLSDSLFTQIVDFRRDIHQHPELSWEEHRTQDRIAAFLEKLGVPFWTAAKTGIIAEFPGALSDAPRVVLRADTDALPIIEETGLPFASENKGVMHACGHDGHTSMLLGAASLMTNDENRKIPVRLIFQPAEEKASGAKAMIADGALDNAAMIFGGHIDRHYPLGTIIATEGPVNASSDTFDIFIGGKGGHAARPHETIDAVVVGSLLVMAIQTIVSREVNPAHPSVVTVGRFDAGTASNVISARAHLSGTIRAQDFDVRMMLQESIRRISKSIGQLHGAEVTVEIREGTSAVINPPEMADICRRAALEVVPEEFVHGLDTANMGAEDFADYMEEIPGCYVRFGSILPDQFPFPAHSSKFDFDERVLGVGAAYYHALAGIASMAVLEQLEG